MKKNFRIFHAAVCIVALSAPAAFCVEDGTLNDLFDNGRALDSRSFQTVDIIPVIREVEFPLAEPSRPQIAPEAPLPVIVEVLVPMAEGEKALPAVLAGLGKAHGFVLNQSVPPRRAAEFQIQPYPPRPSQRITFIVHGALDVARFVELKKDPAVRAIRLDDSIRPAEERPSDKPAKKPTAKPEDFHCMLPEGCGSR